MQKKSKRYRDQEQECHMWLSQNLNPKKTPANMTMLEQMAETRAWKKQAEFWKMVGADYVSSTMKQ